MKLAIAVIGGLVLAGPARALDSGELLAACVRLDRDMKVNGSDVSIPSSVDNGVCWGFIAAGVRLLLAVEVLTFVEQELHLRTYMYKNYTLFK